MTAGIECPICGTAAEGGHHIGDSTVFICPRCGGYRLSGTVVQLLENDTVELPSPDDFKELVAQKRGASNEYPVILEDDLNGC